MAKIIDCNFFYNLLTDKGINFFTGVPDSLLKDICSCINDQAGPDRHITAVNEGNAVAMAAGHYLATGRPGLVYMQNSGLGNAVNPLVSLMDSMVYGIPALLLIGWRGSPGVADEPQHARQGLITLSLLDTLGIGYEVLPESEGAVKKALNKALQQMEEQGQPYALVVRPNTFKSYQAENKPESENNSYDLKREETIKVLLDLLGAKDVVVSTTGKISREVYAYRVKKQQGHGRDFICVGSMGHASQVALALAESRPERDVYCLDGDGALLMHMGALALIGTRKPGNFKHILLNNSVHESVGGQATVGFAVDIPAIAKACGYRTVLRAESLDQLKKSIDTVVSSAGPVFLEVRVGGGSRSDLGRPATTPKENKARFMKFINAYGEKG